MLDFRLKSYRAFERRPMPSWGGDMSEIYLDDIYYYIKPTSGQVDDWDDLPDAIKQTYEKLGIPEAERKYLAGVTAQYESEVVFHRNREDLERQGVIFCDMDTALQEYPELVKQYFGTIIPAERQQVLRAQLRRCGRAASFIYVPPGVEVEMPLQAYFRINAENMGQFERTLIIADEGSKVHYIEGCSAPGVHHRLAALRRGRDRREAVGPGHLHDHPELVEQRLQPGHQAGPGRGRGPHGVDRRQHRQPAHHEVPGRLHGRARRPRARCCRWPTPAPASTRTPGPRWSTPPRRPPRRSCPSPSRKDGGRTSYRGLVRVEDDAYGCKSHVQCDALILDDDSVSATPSPTWRSAPATPSSATRPPSPRWPTSSSST